MRCTVHIANHVGITKQHRKRLLARGTDAELHDGPQYRILSGVEFGTAGAAQVFVAELLGIEPDAVVADIDGGTGPSRRGDSNP